MATELGFPLVKASWLRKTGRHGCKVSAELDGVDLLYEGPDAKQLEWAFYRAALRTVLRRRLPWLAPPAAGRVFMPKQRAARGFGCATPLGTSQVDDDAGSSTLTRHLQLRLKAEQVLGARNWFLLSCHGRLMSGPYGGRYVSGMPIGDQFDLVDRLPNGEWRAGRGSSDAPPHLGQLREFVPAIYRWNVCDGFR